MSYTKGDWLGGKKGYGSPFCVYSDDVTGSVIALCQHELVFRSEEEVLANVQLISAAPDMYEALEFALDAIIEERDKYPATYDRIMRTLGKARGES